MFSQIVKVATLFKGSQLGRHIIRDELSGSVTLNGHIITAQQRTTIQQYGDWYTGR